MASVYDSISTESYPKVDIQKAVEFGEVPVVSSYGAYPLAYHCVELVGYGGEYFLCPDCLNEDIDGNFLDPEDFDAIIVFINYEDEHLDCAECGEFIDCAYPSEED